MARLPDIMYYKFYGCGIPKSRAVKFLAIQMKIQGSTIGDNKLTIHFSVKRQRYAGILLLKLLFWLHRFISARDPWFNTLEEAEYL